MLLREEIFLTTQTQLGRRRRRAVTVAIDAKKYYPYSNMKKTTRTILPRSYLEKSIYDEMVKRYEIKKKKFRHNRRRNRPRVPPLLRRQEWTVVRDKNRLDSTGGRPITSFQTKLYNNIKFSVSNDCGRLR